MATIDSSTSQGQVALVESRPVAQKTGNLSNPKLDIQKIAARSEESRSETATEMEKLQERVQAAITTLNERMRSSQHSLSISVDKASKRFVVTVTDKVSGEVIRHIPGESALRVAHNLEALKGVLFDSLF